MSTITKEWLQQAINDYESVRDELPFGLDDYQGSILAALRIALASLEAEPVAYVMADDLKDSSIISTPAYRDLGEAIERTVGDVVALYAAPTAPVSVPDEMTMQKALSAINRLSWQECTRDAYMHGWNACRAAMLRSADGNSPVIPDGWVACSERMPEPEVDVQIYCSDKKEQMVGYLERNEREGCFRFATWRNGDGIYCQPTHWMPLPAAPQQE
jgi:hypothetical protein